MSRKKIITIFEDTPEEQEKARVAAQNYGLEPRIYTVVGPAFVVQSKGIMERGPELDAVTRKTQEIWAPSDGDLVGIVTDLYIPWSDSESDNLQLREPNDPRGMAVYIRAISKGIPCLVCSDRVGHGSRAEWINSVGEILAQFGLEPVMLRKDWNSVIGILAEPTCVKYEAWIKKPIERYQEAVRAIGL